MTTTTKISRSRAGQVWVTVRSVAMPDIVRRELFSDLIEARRESKVMARDIELQAGAEQKRLNAAAEGREPGTKTVWIRGRGLYHA